MVSCHLITSSFVDTILPSDKLTNLSTFDPNKFHDATLDVFGLWSLFSGWSMAFEWGSTKLSLNWIVRMVSLFRCVLQFGAWSYYTSKMNLTTDTSKINLESYEKNGEWEIVGTQVKMWQDKIHIKRLIEKN